MHQLLPLIEQMHQRPRNMLQQSPISFRSTDIRVLNIGYTPPHFFWKVLTKTATFFDFQLYHFSCFLLKMKFQQLNLMLNGFQGLRACKALNCIWLVIALTKMILPKFVAVAPPNRVDAPTSKKYVTVQPDFFQIR